MLKVFRDNLKYLSWVLWGVILVFVLFAFTDFGSQPVGPGAPNSAAAVVGGKEISYQEFQNAYQRVERQYREAYGEQFSSELANQLGLPLQVLNQLVDQRILLHEAERIGLDVTDEELRDAILEFPVFQEDGAFIGEEAYRQVLRNNRMRAEEFESSLRMDLATDKVRDALTRTVYVSPTEVEELFREEAETASIRLLRLPATRFAAEITVDEPELEAYFGDRRSDYRLSERRVVDYLTVAPGELEEAVTVTQEQIQAYYDEHQEEFDREEQLKARHILLRTNDSRTVEQARAEIEAIKARIAAGEDFAKLAGELSDDPGSKVKGGDLGFFGRGAMVKPFEDAAFAAELGDLVGPVESNFGVHLIQVQAKRPGGLQPLAEAEPAIRARLTSEGTSQLAETKARELASSIADSAGDTSAIEALAAAQTGVSFATTAPFGRDDNVPGIGRGTEFTTRAFELAEGGVSEPLQVARGWVVLTVRGIEQPRLPELAEVRQQVLGDLRQARQLAAAKERLTAALDASREISLDDVAAELDVTLEEIGPFGATAPIGSLGRAPEITRLALTLEPGAVSGPIERADEVVVFEVIERTRFDAAAFESEKTAVRERLESQRTGELLQGLLTQRRDELGVTFDPQVFEAFGQTQSVS